jgi:hypothetical protein
MVSNSPVIWLKISPVKITLVLASLLHLQEPKLEEANAVDDVSLGSAILIGIWIFFVTARPRREFSRAQTESLHVYDLGDSYPIDDWSFDPSGSDGGIIEQADSWVLR